MSRGLRGSKGGGAAGACALGVAFVVFVVFGALLGSTLGAASASGAGRRQKQAAGASASEVKDARTLYRITLKLDFDARRYEGSELVSWTNRDDRPASFVYFHLYPNARAEDARASAPGASEATAPEEPRLEVTEARAAGQTLALLSEDEGALGLNLKY